MSTFTRTQRRERVEAKHHPEVFESAEEEAIATDRAVNVLKTSEAYFAAAQHFDLEQQNRGGVL